MSLILSIIGVWFLFSFVTGVLIISFIFGANLIEALRTIRLPVVGRRRIAK